MITNTRKLMRIRPLVLATVLVLAALLAIFPVGLVSKGGSGNPSIGMGVRTITVGTVAEAAGIADYTTDGVADNVELQAAMDALPAGGGRLVVLAGTYNLAAAVTRAIDNVTVEGVGRGTYFTRDGVNPVFTAGGNNWVFSNLRTDAVGGLNMGATTGWLWNNVTVGATNYVTRTTTTTVDSTSVVTTTENVTSITAGQLVSPLANITTLYMKGDILTDRWVGTYTAANTLIGQGTGGAGGLTHVAGSTGYYNTAYGTNTLYSISQGFSNTAIGTNALQKVTTGAHNTAVGVSALFNFTDNVASGGGLNTAVGSSALVGLTTGYYNCAFGVDSLIASTTGYSNNAFGVSSLANLTTGYRNVAMGDAAGAAITTESGNVFIGPFAGQNATGSNNLYIANTNTATPLIKGNFSTPTLAVYGQFGVGKEAGSRAYVSIGGEGDVDAVLTAATTEPWSVMQIRPNSLAPAAGNTGNGAILYVRGAALKPPGVSPVGATLYLEPFTETGAGSFTKGATLYISGAPTSGYSFYTAGGNVHLSSLPAYSDNATAIAAGLVIGDLYRTGGDPDSIAVVH